MVAAGTSVGALVAITAGVAAANPAPSSKPGANPITRASQTNRSESQDTGGGRAFDHDDGFEHDDGDDGWRQLPSDPSASDPGFGSDTGNNLAPPPVFDPGAGGGGGNTSSGGS